jgi:hypothetical protein
MRFYFFFCSHNTSTILLSTLYSADVFHWTIFKSSADFAEFLDAKQIKGHRSEIIQYDSFVRAMPTG